MDTHEFSDVVLCLLCAGKKSSLHEMSLGSWAALPAPSASTSAIQARFLQTESFRFHRGKVDRMAKGPRELLLLSQPLLKRTFKTTFIHPPSLSLDPNNARKKARPESRYVIREKASSPLQKYSLSDNRKFSQPLSQRKNSTSSCCTASFSTKTFLSLFSPFYNIFFFC